jgi:hypothetical protein
MTEWEELALEKSELWDIHTPADHCAVAEAPRINEGKTLK